MASLVKREPRTEVLVPARMRTDGGWVDVKIRNLSAHGLMFRTPVPPRPGTVIEIRRQSIVIIGRAVWSSGPSCGVRTQDVIDVQAVVAAKPAAAAAAAAAGARGDGSGLPERRGAPRRDAADSAERARALSSLMQYGAIAGGVAAAGGALFAAVHAMLGHVAGSVVNIL